MSGVFRDLGVGYALLDQDRIDLVRRYVGILELNLPDRAAGVIDGELQAHLAVRGRGQADEDQAGNQDQAGEQEEPVPLADDVKHDRGPPAGRVDRPSSAPGTPRR